MADESEVHAETLEIAKKWCAEKGAGWIINSSLGKGGTAPVFEVISPDGPRALKIYDPKFSSGRKGAIEKKRIDQQLELKGHACPYLVNVYEGGTFENRLFLLMGRAPGKELEKRLKDIPRPKIRQIIDQVAQAAIFLKSKGLCHRDIKAANVFISDDFEHCTLLDISVIRDIFDPVGIGTDHDGQLPVLATARYSPPEYLFRLLEPGPELWHALSIYQLGALLHDLIMQEPLFEKEYVRSAENRYRFAWIIATTNPVLQADDVDRDLLLTAWRALDKDWKRRSSLKFEDFLNQPDVHKSTALQVLGIGKPQAPVTQFENKVETLKRIREVSEDLQNRLLQYLTDLKVRATHEIKPGGDDRARTIQFSWDTPRFESEAEPLEVRFELTLRIRFERPDYYLSTVVQLSAFQQEKEFVASLDLPELRDEPGIEPNLLGLIVAAFEDLAVKITRVSTDSKG